MPYLHQFSANAESKAQGDTQPFLGALQTIGATACLVAEAAKTLRGHRRSGLRTSKLLIFGANCLFVYVGIAGEHFFLAAMGALGIIASLIPLLPADRWPLRHFANPPFASLNTPPKASALLDIPNIGTQIGNGFTINYLWFGVATLCILRSILQYCAPPIDELEA